jgi:hypothetical protein
VEVQSAPTGAAAPTKEGNQDPNRPAWLPAKFKSAEEMATAYTELEKKQGASGNEGGNKDTTPSSSLKLDTTETATAALQAKGLDFTKLSNEYMAEGKLSDASQAALKEKGFTSEQVNQFIEGQKAVAERNSTEVFNSVGGKERFNALQSFATQVMTPAEIKAYNDAVTSGNYASVKLMLKGLNSQFEAKFGRDGKLTTGAAPNTKPDVFDSFAEYRQAIKTPEYKNNPVHRKAVEDKIARSTFYKGK